MAAEVVDLTQDADHGHHHHLQLHIPMCPISKPSVSYGPGRGGPRGWFRCYVDTSVRKKMQEFHAHVLAASNSQGFVKIPRNMPVGMKIWFFLKRPASDFVSRRRGENRLRPEALSLEETMAPVKPDIDNLAKFLLDALTGVLFEDDAQVVELQMFKLRDSVGLCNGRVAIDVQVVSNKTPAEIMPNF